MSKYQIAEGGTPILVPRDMYDHVGFVSGYPCRRGKYWNAGRRVGMQQQNMLLTKKSVRSDRTLINRLCLLVLIQAGYKYE